MFFVNNEHQKFYQEKIVQAKVQDSYTKSLIYLLSSNQETRGYFKEIYNIKNHEINLECLEEPWQTNTSITTCRLAFNLFGDISSDNSEEGANYAYTASELLKNLDINISIEAIKIRFLHSDIL